MKDRNLIDVLDEIIDIIPDDEDPLITSLKSVQDSVRYTAPEAMSLRWDEAANYLKVYCAFQQPEWQYEAAAIFTRPEVESE